jgi:hypothetical protein
MDAGPALMTCLQMTVALLTQGLACHDVVADTVAKALPRESGGHVLYNKLTPCFFLIAGRSGQGRG